MSKKSNKRSWRKLIKKLQRKRKRQKLASERNKEIEKAELEKLKDPFYKSWLEQQEDIKRQQQISEEKEHQEQEELWLRRELLAQKQFRKDELLRKAQEAKLEEERLKQAEELKIQQEAHQKKREAIKLQAEKVAKEFDDIMMSMKHYLEDVTMKTPTRLNISVESRPGNKACEFFEKTNCCRFDPGCTFNHVKPLLAKIILIKHFFQHPLLEPQEHEEYSRSDSDLELNERDLREAYDEFCEDVWPVLEEFGTIVNFRTIRNIHAHLRGHVFVEYADKRSALKAFIRLQNRYYASKPLNVEFSNIRQWHKGVCGLSLGRKCLKGDKCNFLHLMKNISNKYNQPIENPERSVPRLLHSTVNVNVTPATSWNCEETSTSNISYSRNWRWSESPEMELKNKPANESCQTKSSSNDLKASNFTKEKTTNSSGKNMAGNAASHKHTSIQHLDYKDKAKSSKTETKHSRDSSNSKQYKKKENTKSLAKKRKKSHRKSKDSDLGSHKKSRKSSCTPAKKRKNSDKSPHR